MTQKLTPVMEPATGAHLLHFVGDRIRFTLADEGGGPVPEGWHARLRTNLGRAGVLCKEIIQAHTRKLPFAGASWYDLPMRREAGIWTLELPFTEPGQFSAKAYFLDDQGWQHWPDGPDVGITVHPDSHRTGNTLYCAFVRMFGPTKTLVQTENKKAEHQFERLDQLGYTVIPPSGKFRDLIKELPHIIDTLGCRILHLLPVGPTPTTYVRLGRFGSPYASLDLTGIDPACVEFDRRTTGVDQFCELTRATHLKGAQLFLDIVLNHTGWGSRIQEHHPEWFVRAPDGSFVSPGAWGVTWEDLVELEHKHVDLWDELAEALLTWCRRGVDGFRCDAGYMVPLPAWHYITARVRQEFPETIFFLEGLGGDWSLTENLLTAGGMQWAYSELFQKFSPLEIAGYLDHSLKQSRETGLLISYSETHDNERLAQRGRLWSRLRNQLCALTSVSGGFGFTCGVEWLAPERVNVHSSRGLAWGNADNLIPELARLNRLLATHPCFFDGAKLTRLSPADSPVYALRRDSAEGKDSVLVIVNTDAKNPQAFILPAAALGNDLIKFELLGQPLPKVKAAKSGALDFGLGPGTAYCFSAQAEPQGLNGDNYRQARARAAWALTALGQALPIEHIPSVPWLDLAKWVDENPGGFLAAASALGADRNLKVAATADAADGDRSRNLQVAPAAGGDLKTLLAGAKDYPPVVIWSLPDVRRILPVPPGHWLLVQDTVPFRATLHSGNGGPPRHVTSIAVREGQVACFAPGQGAGDTRLGVERYTTADSQVQAAIRFLSPGPNLSRPGNGGAKPLAISNLPQLRDLTSSAAEVRGEAQAIHSREQPLVLLTNGIGGMARLCVDLGAVKSKYDCVLGANLNPRVPVDRHIFAKRVRVWVNADGFISPLDLRNLASFEPGPPAVWHFLANAGDGRTVEIQLAADMLAGSNITVLHFSRPAINLDTAKALSDEYDVRLTVRLDIEDRNFHSETKRNGGADYHFSTNTHALDRQPGFAFTPASDRQLRVFSDGGVYHPAPEWCENIPHPIEASRGQTASGDAYSPGWFDLPMTRGAGVSLVVSAETRDPDAEAVRNLISPPEIGKPEKPKTAESPFAETDAFGQQLLRAAQAFVVRRDDGVTVIAGYPWFLDWGRDSLICARGLLAAGLVEQVKQLLVIFGRFAKDGTLPNTIHGDDASNRDTSDAPLWYGVACEEAAALSGENLYQIKAGAGKNTIADVLIGLAEGYIKGAPNGIRMDPASGLIWSPSHFTWMDTNYPAGTPREGYPVEIQALWIRLLRQLERISGVSESKRWHELAERAQASLQKYFWLEERGYFSDLLAAKPGQTAAQAVVDNSLRSNCLLVVSLGLVSGAAAQRCVIAALRYLVVPGALRTLAPLPVAPPLPIYTASGQLLNDPTEPYWGHYEGDEDTRRKPAYHNGTAWTWTFPIFCEALARAWDCSPEAVAAARAYLGSMDRTMLEGCLGQIPEIVDGDAPHTQRGCDAQAWGVTEALRVWKFLTADEHR